MSDNNKYKGFFWIVSALLLIVLVAYNLYSGLSVRKVGIPGIFELEFGPKEPYPGEGQHPENVPPDEVSKEVIMRIEELQKEIENNEKQQMDARSKIEHLSSISETDRDAWNAIEDQKRWLEELQATRQQLEQELNDLREHR